VGGGIMILTTRLHSHVWQEIFDFFFKNDTFAHSNSHIQMLNKSVILNFMQVKVYSLIINESFDLKKVLGSISHFTRPCLFSHPTKEITSGQPHNHFKY
jgi:hypothetical protein